MSKVIKQMEMDALRGTFQGVRDLVVLSTSKLSCLGEHTLRSTLRQKKIRLHQVKNSLARRVFRELNLHVADDSPYWQKPTILAWGGTSVSELSREIETELKNPKRGALYKDKFTIKGAIADGHAVSFEQALKMPTRRRGHRPGDHAGIVAGSPAHEPGQGPRLDAGRPDQGAERKGGEGSCRGACRPVATTGPVVSWQARPLAATT